MKFTPIALLVLLAACSTTDRMRDATPAMAPGADEAKVVFYRTSVIGEDAHFPVYDVTECDRRLLGFTETDCYFEALCAPGKHLFLTWGEGEAFVEADLEAGKTYFIRAYSKFGILRPRPTLAPVGKGSDHWDDLQDVWPSLRCRELDPHEASEFDARQEKRVREAHQTYVRGRKAPRVLTPQDGVSESVLPAK